MVDGVSALTDKVTIAGKTHTLRLVPVMLKGDWPYLRSSMQLNAGFNCKRKCHLCDGQVESGSGYLLTDM